MKNRRMHGVAVLATLLTGIAGQVHAGAITLYTNEAAYLAAVGPTISYVDFAGTPGATVSGTSFTPDVTFGTCASAALPLNCTASVLHNSNAITDVGGGTASNGVAPLAWSINLPGIQAIGFHYISGQIASIALVDLPGLSIVDTIDTSSANGFIGLVTDGVFEGMIGVNAIFSTTGGNDRYFIDDFRINATVPAPGVLGLLGIGLLGAIAGRRGARSRSRT